MIINFYFPNCEVSATLYFYFLITQWNLYGNREALFFMIWQLDPPFWKHFSGVNIEQQCLHLLYFIYNKQCQQCHSQKIWKNAATARRRKRKRKIQKIHKTDEPYRKCVKKITYIFSQVKKSHLNWSIMIWI